MASGKLRPGTIFFDFLVGQAVVVGAHLPLIFREFLFTRLFQQQFVEKRRLGSQFPLPRLLFDEGEIFGGQGKRPPELSRLILHASNDHTIGMIFCLLY